MNNKAQFDRQLRRADLAGRALMFVLTGIAALAILFVFTGCAALYNDPTVSDRADPVALIESADTFAVCKAADVATTAWALHSGRFVEGNKVVAVLLSHGWLPYVALSVAIWYWLDHQDSKQVVGAANVITCGVALHNIWIM